MIENRAANGERLARVLELMAEAEHTGIRVGETAAKIGISESAVWNKLKALTKAERCVHVRHTYKDSRYYLPQHAPKNITDWQAYRVDGGKVKGKRPVLSSEGEPIITAATKVTKAEPFVDMRFKVEAPQRGSINSAECRPWAAGVAR